MESGAIHEAISPIFGTRLYRIRGYTFSGFCYDIYYIILYEFPKFLAPDHIFIRNSCSPNFLISLVKI